MINPDHIFAVVETARAKAPLIRSALLQMPQLGWAHASIEATDVGEWNYGITLALVCTGRAFLLSRATSEDRAAIAADVEAVLDHQVGDPSNEFPSLDLEEFEAELRAALAELKSNQPTLPFSDRMNAALGERVCTWVGLAHDPAWSDVQRPLLHMTIGQICNLTTHGSLGHLA